MDLLVDLHEHQLKSLSFGELKRAREKAIAQTLSVPGGRIVKVDLKQGELSC